MPTCCCIGPASAAHNMLQPPRSPLVLPPPACWPAQQHQPHQGTIDL